MHRKKIPQIITQKQLSKILCSILTKKSKYKISEHKKFLRIRNAFMIYSSYILGLRPMETRCIKVEHINLKEKTLFIPAENNKQRNQDTIPLPYFLYMNLISYIKNLYKFYPHSIWLFPDFHDSNECIDRGTHIRFFDEALKDAGLYQISYTDKQGNKKRSLTLYSLRHSFGTNAYEKLGDLRKTANLLRHYDFLCRTTMVYIHTTESKSRRDLYNQLFSNSFLSKV